MRYLVISDIHSNYLALESVLKDAQPRGYDAMLCLGDLVGYGPDPNLCIERLSGNTCTAIAGNHDWASVGRTELNIFNHEARAAILWTRSELTPVNYACLNLLSVTRPLDERFFLCHGSPREPVWEYLVDGISAAENFADYDFNCALIGHSHIALAFEQVDHERVRLLLPAKHPVIDLRDHRWFLNPGSVGQPRDGNPDAAYAMLNTEAQTWEFCRVEYPVAGTQARMQAKNLPQRLIDRLSYGR